VDDVIREDPEEIWSRSRLALAKIHTSNKGNLATPAIGHKKRQYTSAVARNKPAAPIPNRFTGGGDTSGRARRSKNNHPGGGGISCCFTSFSAPTSQFRSASGNLLKFSKNGYKAATASTFTNKKLPLKNQEVETNPKRTISELFNNLTSRIEITRSTTKDDKRDEDGNTFSNVELKKLKDDLNKIALITKNSGEKLQKIEKDLCVINDATNTWQKEKKFLEAERKDSKESKMDAVIEPTTTKFKREEKIFKVESEESSFKSWLPAVGDAVWFVGNVGVWLVLAHLNNFL